MDRKAIDSQYIEQAKTLEIEFFDFVPDTNDKGKQIGQHRLLKVGKSIVDFNQGHGEIWHNHESTLISEGYLELKAEIKTRNLEIEIDELKIEIEKLNQR